MSYFKKSESNINKKCFINKIVFSSSLFVASISCSLVASNFLNNSLNNNILKTETNLNDNVSTQTTTSEYDHTNYFAMPTNIPPNFSGYDLFASTNNSQLVQTNDGILGISTDKSTFYLTSYSGKFIWAQEFKSNNLIKKFYKSNSWSDDNLNNLKIKEWTVLDANNKILAILLNDGTNSFVTCISLATGLFYPSSDSTSYNLNVNNIFVSLGSTDYTTITRIGTDKLFITKNNNMSQSPKLLSISSSAITENSIDVSNLTSSFNGKEILGFFSSDRFLFALTVDTTSYKNSNNKHYFKQYICNIALSGNALTVKNTSKLDNDFITENSTLDISKFKNVAFSKNDSGNNIVTFIDGNEGYNHLNVYKYSSATSYSDKKSLSLEGNTISSVSISSNKNTVYFSNSSSSNNIFLYYVNTSASNLEVSSIRQSTGSIVKNYYLVPVLSYTKSEYFVLQDNAKNNITYLLNSGGSYQNTNLSMNSKYWNLKNVNDKNLWNAFGQNNLPSSFNWNILSPYFNTSNLGASVSYSTMSKNDNEGTIKFKITFTYTSSFLSSNNESFSIFFYINNLYSFNSNFVFNWLDSATKTTTDAEKIKKIANLKSTKYASQITAQDIIDSFISYSIKTTTSTDLNIDTSMVSLSYSNDLSTLNVTITLPTTNMPIGFANSDKHVLKKTYTGFMSITNYLLTQKSTDQFSSFLKTIYPSQLTEENIVSYFLNIGTGFKGNASLTKNDFDINISDREDITGKLKINLSLKASSHSKIPNYEGLPNDVKNKYTNIINSATFSGFKAINQSGSWNEKPQMASYTGSYLPSELWEQYKLYLNGSVNKDDVILLKNLSFSLTDINNLDITCLNENTCDTDCYLKLEFSIKENSKTIVDYDGKQYSTSSNGKLIFNKNFITSSDITYPYKIEWNITTKNKYFYLVDKNNGSKIPAVSNSYYFNIKENSPFSDSSSLMNSFSSSLTESDIASLIDTEGYNYNITLNTNVEKGNAVATIDLSLASASLNPNGNTNNSNFVKTIYIYNFNIPMSQSTKNIIILSTAILSGILVIVLIWYLFWKYKFVDYRKKSYNWKEKQRLDQIQKHLYRKNRYFKNDSKKSDKYKK